MIPRWNIVSKGGIKYKINSLLKTQLDIMMNAVRNDFDAPFIIDGEIEGTGKSVLAQQMAFYVDPTINIDRVAFTSEQFKEAVLSAEKYQAVIWDEAYEGANKFRIMSKQNQMIASMLKQARQKNLFMFIVIPYFTDLMHYIAVQRSWGLIRADLKVDYDELKIKRGFFTFYSRKQKKWLYEVEKKKLDYKSGYKVSNSFVGFFENVYCISEEEYKKKKSTIEIGSGISEREFIEECITRGVPYKNIKEYLNTSERNFYYAKAKLNE